VYNYCVSPPGNILVCIRRIFGEINENNYTYRVRSHRHHGQAARDSAAKSCSSITAANSHCVPHALANPRGRGKAVGFTPRHPLRLQFSFELYVRTNMIATQLSHKTTAPTVKTVTIHGLQIITIPKYKNLTLTVTRNFIASRLSPS